VNKHDNSNEKCPLNDPETAANPATMGLGCSCSPRQEAFVGEFMSDDDKTAAADLIKSRVNWEQFPRLRQIFEHRPSVNLTWHELVVFVIACLQEPDDILTKTLRDLRERCDEGKDGR
jgi:hypothetical protein